MKNHALYFWEQLFQLTKNYRKFLFQNELRKLLNIRFFENSLCLRFSYSNKWQILRQSRREQTKCKKRARRVYEESSEIQRNLLPYQRKIRSTLSVNVATRSNFCYFSKFWNADLDLWLAEQFISATLLQH